MIEISIAWRLFVLDEMPADEMNIVLLINPSLESENCLKLATDYWTGARTERFNEDRIAYWAPSDEVVIRENTEKEHVA